MATKRQKSALKTRLGKIQWPSSTGNIKLKDMADSHLANCQYRSTTSACSSPSTVKYGGYSQSHWAMMFYLMQIDTSLWTDDQYTFLLSVLNGAEIAKQKEVFLQMRATQALEEWERLQQPTHKRRTVEPVGDDNLRMSEVYKNLDSLSDYNVPLGTSTLWLA